MHVNTRNQGAIAGLPDDCAVEVSALITRSGALPLNVAQFPEDLLPPFIACDDGDVVPDYCVDIQDYK